jgi:hypothetical protein
LTTGFEEDIGSALWVFDGDRTSPNDVQFTGRVSGTDADIAPGFTTKR